MMQLLVKPLELIKIYYNIWYCVANRLNSLVGKINAFIFRITKAHSNIQVLEIFGGKLSVWYALYLESWSGSDDVNNIYWYTWRFQRNNRKISIIWSVNLNFPLVFIFVELVEMRGRVVIMMIARVSSCVYCVLF